jgi:hypothetical protein
VREELSFAERVKTLLRESSEYAPTSPETITEDWWKEHPFLASNPDAPPPERPEARHAYIDRSTGALYDPNHEFLGVLGPRREVYVGDEDTFEVPEDLTISLQTGDPDEFEAVKSAITRAWEEWEDAEGFIVESLGEAPGWKFAPSERWADVYPDMLHGVYGDGVVEADVRPLGGDLVLHWLESNDRGHTRDALSALRKKWDKIYADDIEQKSKQKWSYWEHMLGAGLVDALYDEDHEIVAGFGPSSLSPRSAESGSGWMLGGSLGEANLQQREWQKVADELLGKIAQTPQTHPDLHKARIERAREILAKLDPTGKRNKYASWIWRHMKNGWAGFKKEAPDVTVANMDEIIKDALGKFDTLKKQKKLKGDAANIENYTYGDLLDLLEQQQVGEQDPIEMIKGMGGNVIHEDDRFVVVEIPSAEAAATVGYDLPPGSWEHGLPSEIERAIDADEEGPNGAPWCTRLPENFENYTEFGAPLLFILSKSGSGVKPTKRSMYPGLKWFQAIGSTDEGLEWQDATNEPVDYYDIRNNDAVDLMKFLDRTYYNQVQALPSKQVEPDFSSDIASDAQQRAWEREVGDSIIDDLEYLIDTAKRGDIWQDEPDYLVNELARLLAEVPEGLARKTLGYLQAHTGTDWEYSYNWDADKWFADFDTDYLYSFFRREGPGGIVFSTNPQFAKDIQKKMASQFTLFPTGSRVWTPYMGPARRVLWYYDEEAKRWFQATVIEPEKWTSTEAVISVHDDRGEELSVYRKVVPIDTLTANWLDIGGETFYTGHVIQPESFEALVAQHLNEGKRICAWCKKVMGENPKVQGVTHGICDECAAKMLKDDGGEEKKSKNESFESMIEVAKDMWDDRVFDVQNNTAERLVHDPRWQAGNYLRSRLENSGDILREFSKVGGPPHWSYIAEKIRRIQFMLDEPNEDLDQILAEAQSEENQGVLEELRQAYMNMLTGSLRLTKEQSAAAWLTVQLAEGNWDKARQHLAYIERFKERIPLLRQAWRDRVHGPDESMTEAAGTVGWYNPRTDKEVCGRDHHDIVRDNAVVFGLSDEDLQGDPRQFIPKAIQSGWVRVNWYGNDLFLQGLDEDLLRKTYWYYQEDYPIDYVILDIGTDEKLTHSRQIKKGPELDQWLQESQGVSFESIMLTELVAAESLAEGIDEKARVEQEVMKRLQQWPKYSPEIWYNPEVRRIFVSPGDWEAPGGPNEEDPGESAYPAWETVEQRLLGIEGVDRVLVEPESGPSAEDGQGQWIKLDWKATEEPIVDLEQNPNALDIGGGRGLDGPHSDSAYVGHSAYLARGESFESMVEANLQDREWESYAQQLNTTPQDLRSYVQVYDPTGNRYKYASWLVPEMVKAGAAYALPANVRMLLHKFEQLKRRKILPPDQREIQRIGSIKELSDLVDWYESGVTTSSKALDSAKREITDDGGAIVAEGGPWLVVELPDSGSAGALCGGSGWCIQQYQWYDYYRNKGPVYIVLSTKRTDPYKPSIISNLKSALAISNRESGVTEIRDATDEWVDNYWFEKNDPDGQLKKLLEPFVSEQSMLVLMGPHVAHNDLELSAMTYFSRDVRPAIYKKLSEAAGGSHAAELLFRFYDGLSPDVQATIGVMAARSSGTPLRLKLPGPEVVGDTAAIVDALTPAHVNAVLEMPKVLAGQSWMLDQLDHLWLEANVEDPIKPPTPDTSGYVNPALGPLLGDESMPSFARMVEGYPPEVIAFTRQIEGGIDRVKVQYPDGNVWHYYVPTGVYDKIKGSKNKGAIAKRIKQAAVRAYMEEEEDFPGNESMPSFEKMVELAKRRRPPRDFGQQSLFGPPPEARKFEYTPELDLAGMLEQWYEALHGLQTIEAGQWPNPETQEQAKEGYSLAAMNDGAEIAAALIPVYDKYLEDTVLDDPEQWAEKQMEYSEEVNSDNIPENVGYISYLYDYYLHGPDNPQRRYLGWGPRPDYGATVMRDLFSTHHTPESMPAWGQWLEEVRKEEEEQWEGEEEDDVYPYEDVGDFWWSYGDWGLELKDIIVQAAGYLGTSHAREMMVDILREMVFPLWSAHWRNKGLEDVRQTVAATRGELARIATVGSSSVDDVASTIKEALRLPLEGERHSMMDQVENMYSDVHSGLLDALEAGDDRPVESIQERWATMVAIPVLKDPSGQGVQQTKGVDIWVDPSWKEMGEARAGRSPGARVWIMPGGSVYLWDAMTALHLTVGRALEVEGVAPEITKKGIAGYLKPDYENKTAKIEVSISTVGMSDVEARQYISENAWVKQTFPGGVTILGLGGEDVDDSDIDTPFDPLDYDESLEERRLQDREWIKYWKQYHNAESEPSESDINKFKATVADFDPTGGKLAYSYWLVPRLIGGKEEYQGSWPLLKRYLDSLRTMLSTYDLLKKRNRIRGKDRDIGSIEDLAALEKVVTKATTPRDLIQLYGGEIVHDTGRDIVVQVDGDSVAKLGGEGLGGDEGEATWCTRMPAKARDYTARGPLFFIYTEDESTDPKVESPFEGLWYKAAFGEASPHSPLGVGKFEFQDADNDEVTREWLDKNDPKGELQKAILGLDLDPDEFNDYMEYVNNDNEQVAEPEEEEPEPPEYPEPEEADEAQSSFLRYEGGWEAFSDALVDVFTKDIMEELPPANMLVWNMLNEDWLRDLVHEFVENVVSEVDITTLWDSALQVEPPEWNYEWNPDNETWNAELSRHDLEQQARNLDPSELYEHIDEDRLGNIVWEEIYAPIYVDEVFERFEGDPEATQLWDSVPKEMERRVFDRAADAAKAKEAESGYTIQEILPVWDVDAILDHTTPELIRKVLDPEYEKAGLAARRAQTRLFRTEPTPIPHEYEQYPIWGIGGFLDEVGEVLSKEALEAVAIAARGRNVTNPTLSQIWSSLDTNIHDEIVRAIKKPEVPAPKKAMSGVAVPPEKDFAVGEYVIIEPDPEATRPALSGWIVSPSALGGSPWRMNYDGEIYYYVNVEQTGEVQYFPADRLSRSFQLMEPETFESLMKRYMEN